MQASTTNISNWFYPNSWNLKLNTEEPIRIHENCNEGGIERNEKGEIIITRMKRFPYTTKVDHVEALAIREGLQLALETSLNRLEVEMDSKRIFTLSHCGKSRRTRGGYGGFYNVKAYKTAAILHICFLARNGMAHKLAKATMEMKMLFFGYIGSWRIWISHLQITRPIIMSIKL